MPTLTNRAVGVLMPVSSLPGPYGIGCFGREAYRFVDFLAQAGQTVPHLHFHVLAGRDMTWPPG